MRAHLASETPGPALNGNLIRLAMRMRRTLPLGRQLLGHAQSRYSALLWCWAGCPGPLRLDISQEITLPDFINWLPTRCSTGKGRVVGRTTARRIVALLRKTSDLVVIHLMPIMRTSDGVSNQSRQRSSAE